MAIIGFIGAGNMGGAIITGMVKLGGFDAKDIRICAHSVAEDVQKLPVTQTDISTLVQGCDILVLAVKPVAFPQVLSEIAQCDGYRDKLYISIAAGIRLSYIKEQLGDVRAVRVMPNLCLKAGEGMSVLCGNDRVLEKELGLARSIFDCVGKTVLIQEKAIDACTAINGSGPAYVFLFIEAMADAAVKYGIDRQTAYLLASQTVLGSAKMQLETGLHPAILKDMVCSPGGTTIDAVAAMEETGFRHSVISAVEACAKKAEKMSGK